MSDKIRIKSRPNLVEEVIEILRGKIISGKYPIDSTIPSEGELGKSLGVSRNVIREAMRNLRAQGLIEISQGKCPRVKGGDTAAAIDSLESLLHSNDNSLKHLTEVRFCLELEIAALAAQRVTQLDLDNLENDLKMISKANNQKQCIEADISFHINLAKSTHNPIFVMIYTTISKMLNKLLKSSYGNLEFDLIVERHRNIINAIKNRDVVEARVAMHKHIIDSEKDLNLNKESKNGTCI